MWKEKTRFSRMAESVSQINFQIAGLLMIGSGGERKLSIDHYSENFSTIPILYFSVGVSSNQRKENSRSHA